MKTMIQKKFETSTKQEAKKGRHYSEQYVKRLKNEIIQLKDRISTMRPTGAEAAYERAVDYRMR
jgi:hypothetical protein